MNAAPEHSPPEHSPPEQAPPEHAPKKLVQRSGPHPLAGADPATLFRLLGNGARFAPGKVPAIALATAAVLARTPFSKVETWATQRALTKAPAAPPPVFILGHWRSGTTHLFNVMSRDRQFAWLDPISTGMPWDMRGLARVLRRALVLALPADRYIDNVAVNPDSPQEDEIALANMQALSFYHGLYFPSQLRQAFMKGVFLDGATLKEITAWRQAFTLLMGKLALEHPGCRVLVKNPVYTARVAQLREIYPDAKFIHVYRNPYRVYESTRNFYGKLLPRLALEKWPGNENWEGEIEALILETYPRMLAALEHDAARLPPGQFTEMRFEDFEADPLAALRRCYDALGLSGFPQAEADFAAYLGSVREYRKNDYAFPEDIIDRVRGHWAAYIDRWNYPAPSRCRRV